MALMANEPTREVGRCWTLHRRSLYERQDISELFNEESVEEKENDDQNKIRDQKTDPIPPSLNAEQASCIKTLSEEVLKVLSEDPLA
ncbi:uncharacterized protein LOC141537359 isoform X3 [Cotesia typhae]|uniref:uncharacterized protein LOC141537359 isoform X3 n=1 Tax=Cotesia typhae TaxID=2053667 RepID=UPI003D68FB96